MHLANFKRRSRDFYLIYLFGPKKKQTDLIPLVFYLDILGIVKYIPSRPCYITRGLNMPIEVKIRGKTEFLIRSSLTQSIINC